MVGFWQELRSGRWLTADRARAYSLILLGLYAIAIVGWIALSDGWVDRNGKPVGTDFSSFYAAGSLVLEGRAGDVYDMAAHFAREQQIFGAATPYYGWLYPPMFLLVATPLALLPYPLALIAWQGATFALYLAVIAAILRQPRQQSGAIARLWLLAAAAFPAVFVNLGHGQNGFLTAGLLGAALLALPQRPILSGILFGLLAYKPQFGLLIPFALLAGGQWRTMIAAGLTVIALAGATTLAFGSEIWWVFAASTETARKLLLEQGDVGFEKLQSVFAAIRLWGGGISLAYAVQAAASLIAIGGVAWMWRSSRRPQSEGRGVDDRDLAGLAACARLRSDHRWPGDGVHGRLDLCERRRSRLRDQPDGRGLDHAAAGARDCRRERPAARPDHDRGAVWAGDAARDRNAQRTGDRLKWNRASVIRFVSACWQQLAQSFRRLHCGREFRLFPLSGPCEPSPSASLFSRVAG